ncbi:outer membrane beta-barrel protein [Flavobacterium sp. Fl-77]|uniref:Outer membrane beta-barrel protein n=1 Tax=Flavobacterium flavipigmentatum TaxID=2893884 RepID=A0AAJ2VVZ4_9FLAO|nr:MULTISPECIES: outer membrane beta-barrel protein [unclassified Flavobacterium]MDX6181032.1 outer membrane beta-barrel protein [Flavobacterium sp. Fl-33]MDX6184633.1 outer membrane beta-barrel protein [Flavobacterium sp. Fl-77]UFH39735.1 PorT family protein [Flavobacterium sp. F-70]
MKKIIVIAIFLLADVSNAQVTFKPGLRGGAAFSTFSNTQSDYKTDFYLGAFGEINLTKVYALQPEITYIRQGSNNIKTYIGYNTDTGEDITVSRNLEIDYLSLAMINKFTFNGGFQVMVGPTVDFRLQDDLIYENTDVDLTLVAGFGYRLPSGLAFEARFKKGFVDVLDSDYYGSNNGNNDYWFRDYNTNINFQLGVSYSFGGKK